MGMLYSVHNQDCKIHPQIEEPTVWTARQRTDLIELATLAGTPVFMQKYSSMDPNKIDWAEAEREAKFIDEQWTEGSRIIKEAIKRQAKKFPDESDHTDDDCLLLKESDMPIH